MAKKQKKLSKKDRKIRFLETTMDNNITAMKEQPKINWTQHDLKSIPPLNTPQKTMQKSFLDNYHIVADGSAGTGKTFWGIYLALNELLSNSDMERIVIIRSAVATRDIGYLPGDEKEKMSVFERPYIDVFDEVFKMKGSYERMKERGIIEFMPTSFIRGLNWNNAIVVVDEVQNLNFHEINSVLTRLGKDSRVILCGDYIQSDLNKSKNDVTGMQKFLRVIQRMNHTFDYVRFTTNDIVRSEFVRDWIVALEEDTVE